MPPTNDPALIAGSALIVSAQIRMPHPTKDATVPDSEGPVVAYLSQSQNGKAAHRSMFAECTPLGNGKWRLCWSAEQLTAAWLDSLFSDATPWVVVEQASGTRTTLKLRYK